MSTFARPLGLLAAATLALGACTSPAATAPPAASTDATPAGVASMVPAAGVRAVSAAEALTLLDGRMIIDVRSPEEYAAGHLSGAVNISVEAEDFASRIAELDPAAPALVYCRSGRRSAVAAAQMAEAGFSDVIDAGAMDALIGAGAATS